MEGVESSRGTKELAKSRGTGDLLLRVCALILTLTSAIVLGVNKQTTVVPLQLTPSLPPIDVPVAAKWHYLSAFVFFVVSNAIACAYAALSLLLPMANKGGQKGLGMLVITLDMLMVVLLFSSIGAATAIGLMGYQGNSHVQWNKVCNVFDKFCHQAVASIALSLLGSTAFLLLAVLSSLRLHHKSM